MRGRILIIALALALPVTGWAQSTLNFPRAFTPADLGSTGFALVNPAAAAATVTFKLYNAAGDEIGSSSQTIPARGQVARLGTQIFANPSAAGWVQATSTTTGLQGFWVGGDFASFTDGAESAVVSADLILPFITDGTEIDVANVSADTARVTLQQVDAVGNLVGAPVSRDIAARGVLKATVTDLFPAADASGAARVLWINATNTAVNATRNVTATSVVTGRILSNLSIPRETAAVNAVRYFPPIPLTELNFPHVVDGPAGGANYATVVGVTNLTGASQNVTITFTPDGGAAATSVQRTLPANGSLRASARELFSFAAGFQNGWVRVRGTASITGFVAYAETGAGGFAVVPVQSAPRTSLLFSHIAAQTPWYTGLALLNTSSTNAAVEVFTMNPSGGLIGGAENIPAARLTLNAGAKTAKLINEIVAQTETDPSNAGFVLVRSANDVPLYGVQLFFLRSGAVFANIAAGVLAPGINFTPPLPASTVTLAAASPSTVVRGTALNLTGTGFSTIAANNTVVFTADTGTVNATATVSTATTLTVTVPATAISGPVRVRTGNDPGSSPLIVQVALSPTALVEATAGVAAGQLTTGVDIYVPPPAGAELNVTEIAIVNTGAVEAGASLPLSGSPEIIGPGQTRDLVIRATAGMSAANGTSVSVSGSGVAITNARYFDLQGGTRILVVTIATSANAVTGARNIVITNTNRDMTVFAGGLIIQ